MFPSILLAAAFRVLSQEQCMEHLEAHSPPCDFSIQSNLSILEMNTELALWTREGTPWGSSVPDSVFLRYVLPPRVSQEPLVNWRPVFMEAVLPVVEGAETIEEAVLRVSTWSDSILDYRQTQFRDQSPFVTWSSGIGRCEEMTVFFMDALRSAGIPCRQVYTPWWSTVDSNHAWPEVWTPDGWKYTDISSEVQTLNSAWFTERAGSAALVVAIVPDSMSSALRYYGDVSSVNVTPTYAETGLLECHGLTGDVTVSLINWGSYRPLTVLSPGHNSIELGGGVYLLSWGWPVNSMEAAVIPRTVTICDLSPSQLPEHHMMNVRGAE